MANANPSSTRTEAAPTLPPTVLVVLPCTLPPVLLDRLFAIGAARVVHADAPADQWLADTAAAAAMALTDADPSLLAAARLTHCELELVRLLGVGHAPPAIAKLLHRSRKTIESRKSRLKRKLGLPNPTALAQWAYRFVQAARAKAA